MELCDIRYPVILLSIGLFHNCASGEWNSTNNVLFEHNITDLSQSKFAESLGNKYGMTDLCKEKDNVIIHVKGSGASSGGVVDLEISSGISFIPTNFKCTVTLEAEKGYRLLVHLHSYSTGFGSITCPQYLLITEKENVLIKVCDNKTKIDFDRGNSEYVTSTGRTLNVTYVNTNFLDFVHRFSITFTAFKKVSDGLNCPGFLCDNSNCISSLFKSDGRNNCGDWSDEEKNKPGKIDKLEHSKPQTGSSICKLSRESGWCHAYSIKYYYDAFFEECMSFPYSGCGGNENRFDTKKECESTCAKSSSNSEMLPTGAIIGIVLGSVVALVIIIWSVCKCSPDICSEETSSDPVNVGGMRFNSWHTALPSDAYSNPYNNVLPGNSNFTPRAADQFSNPTVYSSTGEYIGDKTEDLPPPYHVIPPLP